MCMSCAFEVKGIGRGNSCSANAKINGWPTRALHTTVSRIKSDLGASAALQLKPKLHGLRHCPRDFGLPTP